MGRLWSIQTVLDSPPSPTIFSEPPLRVSKSFWSPPSIRVSSSPSLSYEMNFPWYKFAFVPGILWNKGKTSKILCFFKKYISHAQANAVKQKWNFIALAMHTQITQAQNWLFLHLFLPVSLLSFTQDHSMCMPCCDFLCKQFPVICNQVCFTKSFADCQWNCFPI